jgi:type I restriction enzyme S subunit
MSEEATLDEFVEQESEGAEKDRNELARKTVCGIPPQDWSVTRLGEVVGVVSGKALPKDYQNEKEGEHPVYKVSDMNATGNQKYVSQSSNWLSKEELHELNHTLYPEGTTILPKVGAALLTNKRRKLTESSSFDNNVMGWVPEEINPEFLYYISCMVDMNAVAQKGAVPSISKAIAKSLKIPSPPLSEQHKIATVLYTVDQAIEKTEEIIDKREEIRRGLMQDIFKYGIDSSGELRSTGNESYQDTKYGSAPKKWDVLPLEDIVARDASITYGIVKPGDHYPEGVPVVKVENITNGEIQTGNLLHTDPKIHKKYDRAELKEGDLLFTIRGTVGRMAFVPECLEGGNLTQDTARIRVENANPEFVRYYLETATPHNYFERHTKGQAVQGINLEDLQQVPVHLPSRKEQEQIVGILDSHTNQIQIERKYRDQLNRLKRGLMQDLLSGTIRTTDTNMRVPEEIK